MIFLLIEFIDELVFGLQEAAWPLIRTDLHLNYVQIGILLSLPGVIGNLIEPFLFILGDIWRRRIIILGGGVCFTAALALIALSRNFAFLLAAVVLFYPASGAFVSLSQASLMDAEPARHEPNMARWTFAGSLGVFLGPLLLGGLIGLGFGWRPGFWGLAVASAIALAAAYFRIPSAGNPHADFPSPGAFIANLRSALSALKERSVLRWLVLLEFSDLMLDVLYGFLALYFVDVAGFSGGEAALGVAVWSGLGLLGDFLLIPLIERVQGLDYLRLSILLELVLFPAFLLVPQPWLKLTLLGLLGFFNSGWYAILQARLFSALPGQSGMALVANDVAGLFGRLLPLGIGLAAEALGLGAAMWLLLAGPLALLIGLPRRLGPSPQA